MTAHHAHILFPTKRVRNRFKRTALVEWLDNGTLIQSRVVPIFMLIVSVTVDFTATRPLKSKLARQRRHVNETAPVSATDFKHRKPLIEEASQDKDSCGNVDLQSIN